MASANLKGIHVAHKTIETCADSLEKLLTPAVYTAFKSELKALNKEAHAILIESGLLLLRTGRIEAMETLLRAVNPTKTVDASFNHIWATFIISDLNREVAIEREVASISNPARRKTDNSKTKTASSFVNGGPSTSLVYLSSSIGSAISKYDVVPSADTLSQLVPLTLRMIPADLKSLRQEVVRQDTPKEEIAALQEEASQEASTHHDLTPSNTAEYLPTLNSVYASASPAMRRPIPIERSHKIVRDSLGPMWDLLKEFVTDLSLTNLVTLLRGFNAATLVVPTLFIVPHVARHARGNPDLASNAYYYALQTLCDDIRYDDVYKIYTKYLRPKDASHPTWSYILKEPRLLALILQGVSRASAATRVEKELLFEACLNHAALSSSALSSYCYAMSRDASVNVSELFSIYERCLSANEASSSDKASPAKLSSSTETSALPAQAFQHSTFMNHIFFGLSVRGAYTLAHQVLSEAWNRSSVISGHQVRLFLDRCIQARQVDLVDDLLNLMRPSNPVSLHRDASHGRHRSTTTSRKLPVQLVIPAQTYHDLFILDIFANNASALVQHITDYVTVESHALDRQLLQQILSSIARRGRSSLIEPALTAFKQFDVSPDVQNLNTVIKAFNTARDFEAAIGAFSAISKTYNLKPDGYSYAALVYTYAYSSNLDKAIDVLSEMEEAGTPISTPVFESLIEIASTTSLEKAEWLLEHMRSRNVPETVAVYKPLLLAYARDGNHEMFRQHLDHLVQASGLSLTPSLCISLIEALSILGDFKTLQEWLLPVMKREGIIIQLGIFGALLKAYYRLEKYDNAEKLLKDAPDLQLLRNRSGLAQTAFFPALRYLVANDLSRTWKLLEDIEKKCGVPVGQDMYATILEEAAESPNTNRRAEALEWMKKHLHPVEYEALQASLNSQSQS